MKRLLFSLAISFAALSQFASAQNNIKLFDATPITASSAKSAQAFASTRIELSCPAGVPVRAVLTGPNGGPLVVDNFVRIGRDLVLGDFGYSLFEYVPSNGHLLVGEDMDSWFGVHRPIDVSQHFAGGSGNYSLELLDWGGIYGNSELNLDTNCSLSRGTADTDPSDAEGTQVCHRNMGKPGQKTLTVGASAISAHLDHGDVVGPCSE